ncbi:MAG: exosome complex RNA-binding protein Csl4 [Thermoplasmata archaeon]|nr:exosome complex RNA-binding protein Csl4 [Thermoplasmata archaeon]
MSETPHERFVMPGELLGTAEEYVPGHGTYEDSGRVYAALLGHAKVDSTARAISVEAVHGIPRIGEGDLVYARVDELKSQMAICTILASAVTNRSAPGAPEGTVHISKAKDGYTDSLGDEFAPGDILLARVLQGHPSIKLTTAAAELGVVAARCQTCHAPLTQGSKGLVCMRCGAIERRKQSREYGVLRAGEHGAQDRPAQ